MVLVFEFPVENFRPDAQDVDGEDSKEAQGDTEEEDDSSHFHIAHDVLWEAFEEHVVHPPLGVLLCSDAFGGCQDAVHSEGVCFSNFFLLSLCNSTEGMSVRKEKVFFLNLAPVLLKLEGEDTT